MKMCQYYLIILITLLITRLFLMCGHFIYLCYYTWDIYIYISSFPTSSPYFRRKWEATSSIINYYNSIFLSVFCIWMRLSWSIVLFQCGGHSKMNADIFFDPRRWSLIFFLFRFGFKFVPPLTPKEFLRNLLFLMVVPVGNCPLLGGNILS